MAGGLWKVTQQVGEQKEQKQAGPNAGNVEETTNSNGAEDTNKTNEAKPKPKVGGEALKPKVVGRVATIKKKKAPARMSRTLSHFGASKKKKAPSPMSKTLTCIRPMTAKKKTVKKSATMSYLRPTSAMKQRIKARKRVERLREKADRVGQGKVEVTNFIPELDTKNFIKPTTAHLGKDKSKEKSFRSAVEKITAKPAFLTQIATNLGSVNSPKSVSPRPSGFSKFKAKASSIISVSRLTQKDENPPTVEEKVAEELKDKPHVLMGVRVAGLVNQHGMGHHWKWLEMKRDTAVNSLRHAVSTPGVSAATVAMLGGSGEEALEAWRACRRIQSSNNVSTKTSLKFKQDQKMERGPSWDNMYDRQTHDQRLDKVRMITENLKKDYQRAKLALYCSNLQPEGGEGGVPLWAKAGVKGDSINSSFFGRNGPAWQ